MTADLSGRHPGAVALRGYLDADHLPPALQAIVAPAANVADEMFAALPDSAEFTTGLRKLVEAKDCFVRAKVDAMRAAAEPSPVNTPEPFVAGAGFAVDADG